VCVAAEIVAGRSGNVDLLVEVGPQERLGHVGLAEVGVTRVADAEQGAECRLVHHRGVDVVRVVVEPVALLEALRTCAPLDLALRVFLGRRLDLADHDHRDRDMSVRKWDGH